MVSSEKSETISGVELSAQLVATKQALARHPIRRLEKDVADRIAAGEVILRPASVVKELLENSLDAFATQIEVSLLDGGLKTIKFKDNGEGIHPDDLSLLCERFATSKLTKVEDLFSLGTFGFRGEALASISFVSHVTVTTMKEDSDYAYQAYFENGQLVPADKLGTNNPKKCSGVKGTTFIVEDLFYNCPLRKRSLSNTKEEYRFIIDLLMKYSVRYPTVSFCCRRLENTKYDFFTPSVDSELSSIGNVYGKKLTEELVEIGPITTNFTLHGYVTNANFSLRRPQYIFFVNGRLVEWQPLKRAISSLYTSLLPKGGHPFIYIDLAIEPHLIDVNVHPAKQQVYLFDEDNIVQTLLRSIETKLTLNGSSRNFQTVSLRDTSFRENIESFVSHLERHTVNSQNVSQGISAEASQDEGSHSSSKIQTTVGSSLSLTPSKESRPYKKIRTSTLHSSRTLENFFATQSSVDINAAREAECVREAPSTQDSGCLSILSKDSEHLSFYNSQLDSAVDHKLYHGWNREAISVLLRERLALLKKNCHDGIKKMLNESCFVGSIDEDHILIQYQTKLFWLNLTHLSKSMFFQRSLETILQFNCVATVPKIPVYESVLMYLSNSVEKCELQLENRCEIGKEVCNMLSRYRNLLHECCAITFEGNQLSNFFLTSVPHLSETVSFSRHRMGEFLFHLGGETRWHDLEAFLEDVFTALSYLFSCKYNCREDTCENSNTTTVHTSESDNVRWQQRVLESLRYNFEPPKECSINGDVMEITSLERLYRVFERC